MIREHHKTFSPYFKRGKFIVLYGANNIGKSTQVQYLAKNLLNRGMQVLVVKYPIYALRPTGPLINDVLRRGKKMDQLELQKIFAQNRRDFEPTLKFILEVGIHVIAEDYLGTGIAWGMVRGLKKETLLEINRDLLEPDISILMDGPRFRTHIEKGHLNEDVAEKIWLRSREVHRELAKELGWRVISSRGSREEVERRIWEMVYPLI